MPSRKYRACLISSRPADCGRPSCRTAMLKAAVDGAELGGLIDTILSVEEVGVYKPHLKVYQLAVNRQSLPASEIAFQSSNSWDTHAAAAFDMQVVWCNRYGQRRERLPGTPPRGDLARGIAGARGRSGAHARDFVMARCVQPVTSVLTEPKSVGRPRRASKRSHRACRRTSGGGGSSGGFGCRLNRSPTAPGRLSRHVCERHRHRHFQPVRLVPATPP
jgi:hypothetical protein